MADDYREKEPPSDAKQWNGVEGKLPYLEKRKDTDEMTVEATDIQDMAWEFDSCQRHRPD
jgi:hypothetical protein